MTISIEESIQRLKAEIIAPDWRLSGKRIDLLEEAFACLKQRFKSRKGVHAILTMATSALEYVRNKGDQSPPDSVDFLKESMAHVVNIYEDGEFDPEKEEKIFKSVYARFQALKRKIQSGRRPAAEAERADGQARLASAPGRDAAPGPPEAAAQTGPGAGPGQEVPAAEVQELLQELKISLARAEEIGAVLRGVLAKAQAVRQDAPPLAAAGRGAGDFPAAPDAAPEPVPTTAAEPSAPDGILPLRQHVVKKCPATPVRQVFLGEAAIGVHEQSISLIRPLAADRRQAYLRSGRVPLTEFRRLFRSLARQFRGPLSTIPDRKLKNLALPVMAVQGVGLPELPDEEASTLLVVSSGNWHGILFCTAADREPKIVVQFLKALNGDVVGKGFFREGGELPLLNVPQLLRREGFLALV